MLKFICCCQKLKSKQNIFLILKWEIINSENCQNCIHLKKQICNEAYYIIFLVYILFNFQVTFNLIDLITFNLSINLQHLKCLNATWHNLKCLNATLHNSPQDATLQLFKSSSRIIFATIFIRRLAFEGEGWSIRTWVQLIADLCAWLYFCFRDYVIWYSKSLIGDVAIVWRSFLSMAFRKKFFL